MVILIIHSDGLANLPSGELKVLHAEAEMLIARQHDVYVSLFKPDKNHSRLRLAVDYVWSAEAHRHVRDEIIRCKPDIVHFHGLFPFLSPSAIFAAYELGVPVIQTLHNGRWLCVEGGFFRNETYCDECITRGGARGVVHACNRGLAASFVSYVSSKNVVNGVRLFKWVDRFIAVSEFIRVQHVRAGFPAEKIIVKSNCIDLAKLASARAHWRSRSGIAFISRISVAKGSNVLLSLALAINEDIHVVGDGPDLVALKRQCHDAGLQHVRFWGIQSQEQCFAIMSSVVCTVVPSQCGESFSLVAAESMGLGTPVVGSDIGGLSALIHDSGGGILVSPGNTAGFIAAVRYLLAHSAQAERMGITGCRFVERHLNSDINSTELMEIYAAVLKENKRRDTNV